MTDQQSNGNYHPAVREVAAEISATLHERDQLRETNTMLTNQLAIANGTIDRYRDDLDRITKERDYFYRKAFAYTNTLSNARNQIEAMLNLADHEAENPGPIPTDTLRQLEDKISNDEGY